jgi:hypothetical protein
LLPARESAPSSGADDPAAVEDRTAKRRAIGDDLAGETRLGNYLRREIGVEHRSVGLAARTDRFEDRHEVSKVRGCRRDRDVD